jgi:tetratricopeptide (TPR) repeat protein
MAAAWAAAWGVVLFITLFAPLGCGEAGRPGESPSEVVAEPWRGLPAVEHPDLSSLEGPVRASLETCRQRLRALLADATTPAPALAEAFVRMAELYHAYGLLSAADTAYANALQLHGGEARWAYEQGLLKRRQGQEEEALEAFRQAGQWDPERPEIRLQQGEALLALGRAEEARRLYQDLLAASPKEDGERAAVRAAALDGLGRASAALGNLDEAAKALGQALEIQPQAGSTRYALAQVERQRGHKERAQALLAKGGRGAVTFPDPWAEALKDLAEGTSALLARGGEALVNGRLEEAEAFYRRAVELAPDHVEAQRNLAVALTRSGRFQEAEEVLQAALRRRPGEALLLFDLANAQLARAQLAQGGAEEALASFGQAVAAAPDFEAARFNQANALMQFQRYGEAEAALRELLAIAPGHAQGRYLLAMAIYQQGRRPEGIEALRQLLAAEPDLFAARLSLASVLAQEGDGEGARREAALALGQSATAQEQASIYSLLGQLSKAAGRLQEAEAQWRKALDLAPQFPEALKALGDL